MRIVFFIGGLLLGAYLVKKAREDEYHAQWVMNLQAPWIKNSSND